jgi:hypothetical protein
LPTLPFCVTKCAVMDDTSLANSADYADTLLTARKARSVLILVVLLMLLFQLGFFFVARYEIKIDGSSIALDFLKYLVGVTDFLGVILPLVLAAILLLIALVMLVGRVLGVSRLVSAFIGCIVLAALLFPWQAFLMNQTFSSDQFRIPGVLYTWSELVLRARIHPDRPSLALLYWARFVGWPVAAIVLLLKIQYLSGKGLAAALRGAANGNVAMNEPAANS